MRTTLTLDDDVAERLQNQARAARKPFKSVVNEMLRLALNLRTEPTPRRALVWRDALENGDRIREHLGVSRSPGRPRRSMILLDASLLIYAYDHSSPFQQSIRQWLDRMIKTEPVIGLPWISILAFLRITTHSALANCQSFGLAAAIIDDWLALPNVRVISPGAGHWPILMRTASEAQARGAFVTDAALAALAIETGATLCSHDKGFRRFPGSSSWTHWRPDARL